MNTRKRVFKAVSSFLILVVLLPCFCLRVGATAPAPPATDNATSVCLYNINTNATLYKKETSSTLFPGSAVKMMTGLIACEMLSQRLTDKIVITDAMLANTIGANVRLKAGMSVTVENLLYGVICGSGNDAALALASVCSGSVEAFVALMNAKANEWGLRSTYFTNPTGLDDASMYSTLSDILRLSKKAASNELYLRISSSPSFTYSPYTNDESITIFNRNALISSYYADGYKNANAKGLIAGNTDLGGYCAITLAQKGDESYICIVTGASKLGDTVYSYKYVNDLLDFAYSNYSMVEVLERDTVLCYSNVKLAIPNRNGDSVVPCVSKMSLNALLPYGVDVNKELEYRYYFHYDELHAPLSANTIVGGVDVLYNGEVIASAPLVTRDNVEANAILSAIDGLKSFFTSRVFIICILSVAASVFTYVYFSALKFKRKIAKSISYRNFY